MAEKYKAKELVVLKEVLHEIHSTMKKIAARRPPPSSDRAKD
jgi:hypothetical protein